MSALFFYGTLRHLPLLEVVLGRSLRPETVHIGSLADHVVRWVKDEPFPMIQTSAGLTAEGLVVTELSDLDVARIDYYEGGFAYTLTPVEVDTAAGRLAARVYLPDAGRWTAGEAWSLTQWEATWAALSVDTAGDVMRRFGDMPVEELQPLLPFLRARAWARHLAKTPAPCTLRSDMGHDDIEIHHNRGGFDGFFSLQAFNLRHRKFNGDWTRVVGRESFVAFDAALILPYDPVTDRVLLIEQMRYGPIHRQDPHPWVFEPIAGLVDAGEDPIETARREAVEEAQLTFDEIRPMSKVYPSPGYSSEFFHCFLGLCDLSARSGGLAGLASENEDIRSHVLPFGTALDLVDSGEINAAPLVMMLFWLLRQRDALRAEA
ncbi:MAG: gamma-glutamylcyclotransferase [Rhodobacteraceae bacterium]|nr:gamma-glutamylcyclotransferase [Paracoccaceae bacterium]